MDPKVLQTKMQAFIKELVRRQKTALPSFQIEYHVNKHGMKYHTWKQMVAGRQRWTLEYFIKTAESFSIPADQFLKDFLNF